MPSFTRAIWEAFSSILNITLIPLEIDLLSDASKKNKGKHFFGFLVVVLLIVLLVIYAMY